MKAYARHSHRKFLISCFSSLLVALCRHCFCSTRLTNSTYAQYLQTAMFVTVSKECLDLAESIIKKQVCQDSDEKQCTNDLMMMQTNVKH